MTRALYILLVCVCYASAQTLKTSSYSALINAQISSSSYNPDACSTCTNETWEGTGTSTAGWLYFNAGIAGAVTNVNYATAPAPLAGSQSLLLKSTTGGGIGTDINMPSSTEAWMRFAVNFTNTIPNGNQIAWFANNASSEQARLELVGNQFRVTCGTANATTSATVAANTTYYVWFHYKKGTGVNAVADVAFSTSKTRPLSGSGFAQLSNGTSTQNLVEVGLYLYDLSFAGSVFGVIYDSWSCSVTGAIGDMP